MNDAGQIVGGYSVGSSGFAGYLYSGGVFTTIAAPWDVQNGTTVNGINNAGVLVVNGFDALGNTRNSLGTPVYLPEPGNPGPGFNFDFSVVAGETYYIDPAVATGYTYSVGAGNPAFASVILPAGIGDNLFELWLPDGVGFVDSGFGLTGGIPFDFLTHGFANGLTEFQIRGIETSAFLDPNDALPLPTGLTFVGNGSFTGSMAALTANVPEPGTLALLGVAMAGLAWRRGKPPLPARAEL